MVRCQRPARPCRARLPIKSSMPIRPANSAAHRCRARCWRRTERSPKPNGLHEPAIVRARVLVPAARRDQAQFVPHRPSRAQVAARLPISSSRPIRPANTGSTPMPRTTLASRIFSADPVVALEGVGRAHREHARHVDAAAVGEAARVAAGRVGERREHLGGRRHLGELARIGGADIDQRGELAVGRAPQAELVGVDHALPQARLAGVQRERLRRARRRRQRHRR